MKLRDFITEAKTEEGQTIEDAFVEALKNVFTSAYLSKIQKRIGDDILIKKKDFGNPNAIAYTKGRTIYVNDPVFGKLPMKEKTKHLLHEFIHVMQNTNNKMVVRSFKEVYDLADQIWPIVTKHLDKDSDIALFLTGKRQSLGTSKKYLKYEVIAYLMNSQKIRWDLIPDEAHKQIIDVLRKSRVFNLNSEFWIKRLKK